MKFAAKWGKETVPSPSSDLEVGGREKTRDFLGGRHKWALKSEREESLTKGEW